jgi:hypothetical protein
MTTTWKSGLLAMAGVALMAGAVLMNFRAPAEAQGGGGGGKGGGSAARYSVIETNGQNLLVTDNKENTLYYYSIDKEDKIGAPLKLRAQLDLTQVGKPDIKITPVNPQK